jgi:pimeloyl-ACP methyl ester carboxylesterase
MPHADINGFRMFYDVQGSGFPTLFIHGGFAGIPYRLEPRSYDWLTEIADRYQLIVYHRRGCGWSSCPRNGWTLENFVVDAKSLLERLGIRKAHVIGSSAGGPIALLLALSLPERTQALVLVNTSANLFAEEFGDVEVLQTIREQIGILERQGPEVAYRARPAEAKVSMGALWDRPAAAADGTLEEYDEEQGRLVQAAKALSHQEKVQLYATELRNIGAYVDVDLRPRLQEVQVPTLIIHGSEDKVVPVGEAYELQEGIPGAELAVMPGLPHAIIHLSRETRLRVAEFLQQVDESLGGS